VRDNRYQATAIRMTASCDPMSPISDLISERTA
jgi:hypothetical protein